LLRVPGIHGVPHRVRPDIAKSDDGGNRRTPLLAGTRYDFVDLFTTQPKVKLYDASRMNASRLANRIDLGREARAFSSS
jgi:hypothetical protein